MACSSGGEGVGSSATCCAGMVTSGTLVLSSDTGDALIPRHCIPWVTLTGCRSSRGIRKGRTCDTTRGSRVGIVRVDRARFTGCRALGMVESGLTCCTRARTPLVAGVTDTAGNVTCSSAGIIAVIRACLAGELCRGR